MLVWHGGSAMTEASQENICHCIQKDILKKKIVLLRDFLIKWDILARCYLIGKKIKNIGISSFQKMLQLCYLKKYVHIYPNVCTTNWCEVDKITEAEKQEVYDIEVKDTHCFFANGILVHNCHHTAAKTCKEVLLASPNAYWRFGGSATPNRESGDDIMIQAVFGAKIVDISASYLIKKNWLVKPYIFFEPVRTDVNLHSYQKVYSECVVKNDPLNDHIADTANHLVSRGLSVLVLVQQYAHGDYLKAKIPGSEFMTGRLTSAKRTQILDDMRSGKLKAVIASSLADEGLNVPTLDAVLLAGCGKSSTRLFQRIGRTLRKDKAGKKNKSIVIVYDHNAKYLSKHVKKVKTLLKREEEFVVRSSAGEKFILKELDDLLGFKNDTKSVFE
jgi:ERCC4-related helicase